MKIYNKSLQKIVAHEKVFWDNIFKVKLEKDKKRPKRFSSFWDEDYYMKITDYVNFLFLKYKYSKLLEAGSGSGRASTLLNLNINKTLLDISPVALRYAKHIAKKFKAQNIEYIWGNIFEMPFDEKTFDFVWNIGVIEHYETKNIILIFREMIRVTKKSGMIAIGVPNFYSGPIIKAFILKYRFLKFIPGYRLDTEHFYNKRIIQNLLKIAAQSEGRKIRWIKSLYFGNPLPTELPSPIIKTLGKLIEILLPRNRFLILFFCKLEK